MIKQICRPSAVALLFVFSPAVWAATNSQAFTFQGRLLDAAGTSPMTGTVAMTLGIYDPNATCLLYEETDSNIDLSTSGGIFSVAVGSATGSSKRTSSDPGLSMSQVFANTGAQLRAVASNCTSGYTPAAQDNRVLRVMVTPQGGIPFIMSPDQVIDSSAHAWVAETVQGIPPSGFLQPNSGSNLSQTTVQQLTSGSDASTLHHHDSLYAKLSGNGSIVLGTGSYLGLGSQASAPTGLGPTDAGKIWYNTSSNQVQYWDGTTAQAVGSGSGSGSGTITAVTAGTYMTGGGSSGNVTLNVSIPSANSIASGLLSSSDWLTFNGKQSALGYTPANKAGDTLTGNLKLVAGTSTLAPLSFQSGIVKTSPSVGDVEFDGSNLFFTNASSARQKVCSFDNSLTPSTNQVLAWNGSAWVPTAISSAGGVTSVTSGGAPITVGGTPSAPTISLSTVPVTLGGTGVTTLTGLVKGNGASAFTVASPGTDYLISSGSTTNGHLATWNNLNQLVDGGAVPAGTITGVTAGTGLSGGGTSGTVTLNVNSGNLTEATSSVLTITGGSSSVLGSGTSIQVKQASGTQSGYLSNADWVTFNGKQSALGYTPANKAGDTLTGNLKLAAGATTLAPMSFQSGTVQTSPSPGDVEFDGSNLFFTNAGSVRQKVCSFSNSLTPATNQVLAWNGSAWVPTSLSSAGGVTSVTSGGAPITVGGTASAPTISLSTVPVTSGGTGATTLTGIIKGNGTSAFTAASPGTDYAPATSGSSILKGNGAGGFSSATPGTDYLISSGSTNNGHLATWNNLGQLIDGGAVPTGTITGVTAGTGLSGGGISGNVTLGVNSGNLTEATSSVLTITGGSSSVLGSGTSIQVKQASGSQSGYLSNTDWNTFNNKQSALAYTPVNQAGDTVTGSLSITGNSVLGLPSPSATPTPLAAGNVWYDGGAIKFYNGSSVQTLGVSGSGIQSLTAGSGLTGGTITSTGTVAVDSGTGANQIVKLDGNAKLPPVDGSQLTNVNLTGTAIHLNSGGSSAANTLWNNNGTLMWVSTALNVTGSVASSASPGYISYFSSSTTVGPSNLYQNLSSGLIGIGTTSPGAQYEVDTTGPTVVGEIIKGYSSQSGDLLELQDSTGTVLSKFNASGDLILHADPSAALGAATKQYVDSAAGGKVTSVTASAPLSSSGGATPNITLPLATSSANGYLSSSDWSTFNNKASISGSTTNGNLVQWNGTNQLINGPAVSQSNTASAVVQRDSSGNVNAAGLILSPSIAEAVKISPYGASAGQTGDIHLYALSGSTYVGLKAPDTVSSSKVWVLPSADGTANQCLKTDGSGNLGWITPLTSSSTLTASNLTGTVAIANGGTGATTASAALTALGAAPTASPTFTGSVTMPGTGIWNSSGNVGIGTASPTAPLQVSATNTATSGSVYGVQITPTYNQASGTAANTDLLINRTQTAVGSGSQKLIDAQVGGSSKFSVDTNGNVTAAGTINATTATSATTATNFTGSLNGDVTGTQSSTAIAANAVTNTKLATMAANSLKGNNTGSTATAADLTVAQVNSMLTGMTTLGDMTYGGTSGAVTRLAGNTASTKKFLTQTGTGTSSAVPAWGTLATSDLPASVAIVSGATANTNVAEFNGSGQLVAVATVGVSSGGTGTSTTSQNYVFAGPTSGAGAPSFRALASSDLPAGAIANSNLANSSITLGSTSVSLGSTASTIAGLTSITASTLYGSSSSAGDLILDPTSNAAKGNIQVAPNGGNVGIGTASPTQQLELTGNALLPTASGAATGNLFFGGDTTAGTNGLRLFSLDAGAGGYIDVKASTTSKGLAFRVDTAAGGTERMRINANGNVGIGTASPTAPLQISATNTATSGSVYGVQITPTYNQASGTAANTDLLINRTQTAVGSGSQKLIDAQVGGSSKFSVDASGNVTAAGTINATTATSATTATNFTGSLSGDVTGTQSSTAIAANAVTNAKLATMAATTLKGNNAGSTANASDLTVAQVNSMLTGMTTLGDMTYGGTSGAVTRLAGNTASTKKFLTQTGTGTSSAVPAWGTLATSDLPASVAIVSGTTANTNVAEFNGSGQLVAVATVGVSSGGTGASTTSQNYVFAGPTSGAGAPSFRALASSDLPAGVIANSSLANSSITLGSTSVALGSTASTIAGLTSITAGSATFSAGGGVYLSDVNKGIAYSGANAGGSYFATSFPTDGISVFGWVDGALGTKFGGNKVALSWNSSGNVGIGTTDPGFPLNFADTLGDKISLWGASGAHYGFGIQGNLMQIYSAVSTADIAFGYGSSSSFTEAMRIKGNGNVGIGTASPVDSLNVNGSIAAGVGHGDSATATNYSIYSPDSINSSTSGATAIYAGNNLTVQAGNIIANAWGSTTDGGQGGNLILKAGHVSGIGNNGSAAASYLGGNVQIYSGYGTYGGGFGSAPTIKGGRISFFIPNEASFSDTTYTERMTINSTGNVGIGTTSPAAPLEVVGKTGLFYTARLVAPADNGMFGALLNFDATTETGGKNWLISSTAATAGEGQGKFVIKNNTDGTYPFVALSNGNVGIGTFSPDNTLSVNGTADKTGGGSWGTFSDARLKEINGNFTRGLDDLNRLNPVWYQYKKDNAMGIKDHQKHTGFIAQEVEKVIPEAVEFNSKGYRILNQDPILWTMLNSIKELYKKVSGLAKNYLSNEARIKALETENTAIKTENASIKAKDAAKEQRIRILEADSANKNRQIESLKSESAATQQENSQFKAYLCAKDPSAVFCH